MYAMVDVGIIPRYKHEDGVEFSYPNTWYILGFHYDSAVLLYEAYAHLGVRVALVLPYNIVELRDRAALPLCIVRWPKHPTIVWVVSGVYSP